MDPTKMSGWRHPVEMAEIIVKTPLKMLYEYWDWRFLIESEACGVTEKRKYILQMSHRDFESRLDFQWKFDSFWEAEEYVFSFFSKLK